jgi:hypothetical protein
VLYDFIGPSSAAKARRLGDLKEFEATTTTYKATDMCDEPANITSAMLFRDPGFLHSGRF